MINIIVGFALLLAPLFVLILSMVMAMDVADHETALTAAMFAVGWLAAMVAYGGAIVLQGAL